MGAASNAGEVQRFELDARAEREVAWLRIGAAVVSLIAGVWLLLLPYRVPWAFGLLALIFAGVFLRRAVRARAQPVTSYLELDPEGLTVCDGDRLQSLRWTEVASVSIDEDRLLIAIARHNAPAFELEPRYRGVSLYELAQAIQRTFAAARTHGGCAPAADG